MAINSFEDAITVIADTSDPEQTLPNRAGINGFGSSTGSSSSSGSDQGSSSAEWLSSHAVSSTVKSVAAPVHNGWDIYWWGSASDQTVLVGAMINKEFFNNPQTPYQNFTTGVANILALQLAPPNESNVFSQRSMYAGSQAIENVASLLNTWRQTINGWANDIDVPDGDFQGSAAGIFKNTLLQFTAQMNALTTQLATQNLADQLYGTGAAMVEAVWNLQQAFETWNGDASHQPAQLLANALANRMVGATLHYNAGKVKVDVKDAQGRNIGSDQTFWDDVETDAKTAWTASLSTLDTAAASFLSALDSQYQTTLKSINTNFVPPPNLTGTGPNGGTSGGSDIGSGGGINLSGLNLGGSNGDQNALNNLGNDLNGLLNGGSGGTGANANVGGSNFDLTNGGSSGGDDSLGAETVDGPNGLPLTDTAGDPITVPAGSTIEPDGTVIGPDGEPVLGSNGQPLTVPKGSTVALGDSADAGGALTEDGLVGPDGRPLLDANGNPITVPEGSTIGPNGTVIGPGGQLVTGPNGQPLTVPTGTTVGPTGAPSDGDFPLTGNGRSASGAGLADDVSDLTGGFGGTAAIGGSLAGGGALSGLGGIGKGLSIGGGGSAGGLGASTGARFTSSGVGMSDSAANIGKPGQAPEEKTTGAAADDPAELAAAENAAEEGQMLGRVATVGGGSAAAGEEPPMMPPMSGGMGGTGGGASGGKKTWVTEDEDTWGIAASIGSGVIGR